MKYLKKSSKSKLVLERDDNGHVIFPQETRGLQKCITQKGIKCNIHLPPTGWHRIQLSGFAREQLRYKLITICTYLFHTEYFY